MATMTHGAPASSYAVTSSAEHEVSTRGFDVLRTPAINKGTAFTIIEREALGLTGLLPPAVLTIEQQAERAYELYQRQPDELAKNAWLSALQDRNETLFYYLLCSHVEEMFPIVYTPTVGTAIQQYSHQFRRPRGVFLSIEKPHQIEDSLRNAVPSGEVDLLIATDAESILGIGDWGVGGIDICIGKSAVYTAAAGINPNRVIPVVLDVGTDNQSLLSDPLYLGNRRPRVRGEQYQRFVDRYISVARRLFPNALLHWEDFSAMNARWILNTYRSEICTFNDDIQGTSAVVLAAILSGLKVSSGRMRDQKVVIFGGGTAGCGIADLVAGELMKEGLSRAEALERFWIVGRNGLILQGAPNIREHQAPYARRSDQVAGWERDAESRIPLGEVVRRVHPTVLIGSSTVAGAFTESIVREMAKGTPRPIILPLSNPTSLTEANPTDLISWTEGRALIATGSPFRPVLYNGVSYTIGQANNSTAFPGIGLGAIVTRARLISDAMFAAAAKAIVEMVDGSNLGASILPGVGNLREVSVKVALAVARQAAAEGLTRVAPPDLERAIRDAMWEPRYGPIRAV
jgi:malate dehydrogenase (oxaloacetate-decarboxylating)